MKLIWIQFDEHFSPLSNTVMSGWSNVENEQRSGVDVENERAEWMWRISD